MVILEDGSVFKTPDFDNEFPVWSPAWFKREMFLHNQIVDSIVSDDKIYKPEVIDEASSNVSSSESKEF